MGWQLRLSVAAWIRSRKGAWLGTVTFTLGLGCLGGAALTVSLYSGFAGGLCHVPCSSCGEVAARTAGRVGQQYVGAGIYRSGLESCPLQCRHVSF